MTPARLAKLTKVLNQRQFDLTVVLENVLDPHNISAVLRTAEVVGVQHIYVLNTRIEAHKRFGVKSSSSAVKWVTVHQYDITKNCFDALRQQGFAIYTTHIGDDSVCLYSMDLTQRVALVFGNEHTGVSEEALAQADGNFLLPQAGIIQSLNISVACAVALYEAKRQKLLAGHYNSPTRDAEARQALALAWKTR